MSPLENNKHASFIFELPHSQQTSFLWPFNTRNSFIARMSNTRTVWSREALATRLPFGDQARAWTVFLCWCLQIKISSVACTGDVAVSQCRENRACPWI